MFAPLIEESLSFLNLKKLVIDSGLCSLCGSCGLICEKIDYKDLPSLKKDISCVVSNGAKTCGTLGCCFDNCPMTSFSKKEYEIAFFGEESSDPDLGFFKKIVSARSTNNEILSRAQNGGTITSLLTYTLSGYLTDPKYTGAIVTRKGEAWNPIPFFASKPEELLLSTGSIYSRLPLSQQIRTLLREKHNLIFVGTGCQTTGVRKYQYNFLNKVPPERAHLFLIGVFCYENFPYPQFKDTIQEKSKVLIDRINKMDINKGKLVITIEDGTVLQYPIKEFNHIVPEACKFCTNFTAEFADISVGSVGADDNWNSLIIRSKEGLELVERAEDDGIIETTTKVSLESIRKNVARKMLLNEKIVTKRREKDFYVPNYY
ncbi:MAG: Coenzyme F420 hydrogenase/dehydrogenase, beta subunit C-terminal domain [Candidatus Heimdallarchaeota archaeon]|nr:MAG: Coenzyme F420 hydrogenase/dehydrogenase, beta subunit C-terminal domain [Candidatus Heimdallarchaeota archaeon]